MFYICSIKNKQLLKIIIMKTLILSIAISITAISCGQTEKQTAKFKFYHADTNAEIINSDGLSQAMQSNKAYRLDLSTGECSQYVTNNK